MTNSNEYMRKYMKRRHEEHRAKAIEYLGGACSVCGSSADLHFHHRDPEEKSYSISSGLKYKWERLVVELDKCVLLCADCHRREHESTASCGTAQRYWRGCRCDECKSANAEHGRVYRLNRSGM